MIRLTYKDLNNNQLTMALERLSDVQGLPMNIAYRVAKLKQKVTQEITTARDLFKRILDESAALGEEGQYQFEASGTPKLKEGVSLDQWKTREQEFMNTAIELPFEPIPAEAITRAGLSANEINALGPILTSLDEFQEEDEVAS